MSIGTDLTAATASATAAGTSTEAAATGAAATEAGMDVATDINVAERTSRRPPDPPKIADGTTEAAPSSAPERLLFGAAAALARIAGGAPAGRLAVSVHDLYDAEGASFYDELVGASTSDLTELVRVARSTGGPVLDLACGTGRLTLPLAQRGLDVVGVDLSADMLDRLRARLARTRGRIADRVRVVRADMTSLDLPDRFACATLGATTVVLLDPAARRRFFVALARHLRPGGVFVLDHPVHDLDALAAAPEWLSVLPLPAPEPGGAAFAFCAQRFDVPRRLEDVNFIVERIGADGRTKRQIITTRKHIFSVDELVEDLRAAGLEPVDSRRTEVNGRLPVRVLVCRKSG